MSATLTHTCLPWFDDTAEVVAKKFSQRLRENGVEGVTVDGATVTWVAPVIVDSVPVGYEVDSESGIDMPPTFEGYLSHVRLGWSVYSLLGAKSVRVLNGYGDGMITPMYEPDADEVFYVVPSILWTAITKAMAQKRISSEGLKMYRCRQVAA